MWSQHYRGLCSNTLKQRKDDLEAALLSGVQSALSRPELIEYVVSSVSKALRAALEQLPKVKARENELLGELANLGAAIAKTGGSATLISTLQQKEEELSQLRKSAAALRDDKISIWSEARLRKRIKSEISNLPALLNEDPLRARTEILRHVG